MTWLSCASLLAHQRHCSFLISTASACVCPLSDERWQIFPPQTPSASLLGIRLAVASGLPVLVALIPPPKGSKGQSPWSSQQGRPRWASGSWPGGVDLSASGHCARSASAMPPEWQPDHEVAPPTLPSHTPSLPLPPQLGVLFS